MKKRVIPLLGALGLLSAGLMTERRTPQDEPSPRSPTPTERTFTQQSLAGLSSPDLGPILSASSAQVPAGAQQAYVDGQLMVLPSDSASLDDIARDHGASVIREAGPSGYGVLEAPVGIDALAFAQTLRADDRVLSSARNGLMLGAKKGMTWDWEADAWASTADTTATTETTETTASSSALELMWHLESAAVPASGADLSGYVVAVLDSGVADVSSLSGSPRVAPWDFVNDDADPDDDHQHGTHIASIIASSSGSVQGVAPGVSLMPLKVLDENNQGCELDLVDAIYWAVDNGADVINMSLAFSDRYVPSAALSDALHHAASAGVVLVAASGNAGLFEVSWPAASPDVIAVGALCVDDTVAEYSNVGGAMDIMAPGGCIDQDVNSDGIPDGIVAETINPRDGSAGLWAMAGTSQAAAVATGSVIHALHANTAPSELATLAQSTTYNNLGSTSFSRGSGAGALDVQNMVSQAKSHEYYTDLGYHVAVLPYLADNGDGTVTPTARLTVLDQDLNEASWVTVMANLHGSSSGAVACSIENPTDDGQCVISGLPVSTLDEAGEAAALAWRITVDAVVLTDIVAYRPEVLMFGSAELDDIAAAQNADPELREAMLALYWAAGDEPDLGLIEEGYAVVNSGAGLSTSPIAMLFNRAALDSISTSDLSLDGTGLSSSPLGMRWMMLDGSGFSTSPITLLALTAFEGSGLSTSPIAMSSYSMLSGSGLSTSPILMSSGTIDGDGSLGSLQTLVSDGGWASIEGEQAASVLAGSGEFATLADAVGTGAGLGSVEVSLD